jgi:hypothetical protein
VEHIIDRLYLGSDDDVPRAKGYGWARLCVCKDGIDSHRSLLGYTTLGAPKGKDYLVARRGDVMALNVIDVDDPKMIPEEPLWAGLKFIDEQRQKGRTIFVHCNAGHSRSPSLVMMYLRSIGELPEYFPAASKIFRTLYPKFDPGKGMKAKIHDMWNRL